MGVLGVDVRREAGRAQLGLEGEGVVADRVAVGEGGQELVHLPFLFHESSEAA